MKIFWLILLFVLSSYAKEINNDVLERVVKLEVQINQLEDIIDSRSGLLKEKQEIFIEHEKRLNGLHDKCDLGIKTIDDKISTIDEQFRGLYSQANYGIIGIAAALILAILFICRMLNRSLNKLEENYKVQIDAISSDAQRRINALISETDTKIRKYQTIIDNRGNDENDEPNTPSSNPF